MKADNGTDIHLPTTHLKLAAAIVFMAAFAAMLGQIEKHKEVRKL